MQTFRTRFTTDISSHQRAMRQFRSNTGDAIAKVRSQLLSLGGMALGGFGVVEASKSVLSLAGNMEKTKVAFEVMLGSAEKAKAVLGDLVKFADITPFDTAEIIQSGRALMACGVATDSLRDRLDLLGNIAAGTNMTITDMVSIYAKMANKGKVQTEELNQMAERGIPIYKTLCDMLNIQQGELAKMAESGKLSFGLIEEALEKLGGKGGQYFGLIEKQSRTLEGLWSTLQGNIRLLATEFGELLIPELSAYLADIIARLEEMKKSGELQQYMQQLADGIISVMKAVVELASFLAKNRDTLFAAGKVIAVYYAWTKVNSALTVTGSLIRSLGKEQFTIKGLRNTSSAVKYLTADLRTLTRLQGKLVTSLNAIAPAAAVAFTGWEIGKCIGQMLDLEDIFTRLLLKAQGMSDIEIDAHLSGKSQQKVKPDIEGPDLAKNALRKRQLQKEITSSKTPEEAAAKKKELAALEESENKYARKMQEAAERRAALTEQIREKQNRINALVAQRDRTKEYITTPHTVVKNPEYTRLEQEIQQTREANFKLNDERNAIIASQKQYAARQKAAADALEKEQKAQAKRISEAEKFKAAKEKEAAEERIKQQQAIAEKQKEIKEKRRQIAKEQQALADEQWRDRMSEKIEKWQKNIEKYQKQIDETEKKLQKFGASVSGNILKTPAEIAQERKDEILRKKIASHNEGKAVRFTDDEKKRIATLQAEQLKARQAQQTIDKNKGRIQRTERRVDARETLRKQQDWRERSQSLAARSNAVAAAQNTMNKINGGKKPVQSYLDLISALLKDRLPGSTV